MRYIPSLIVVLAAAVTLYGITFFGSMILGCYLNERAKTFDHKHVYRPASGAYREVHLHAAGNIEAGGDNVVSKSRIAVSITTNDGQTFVKNLQYSYDGMLVGDETYVRVSATPDALATWLKSLPIELDEEMLQAESKELSSEIDIACKAGSPAWKLKHLIWVKLD